MDTEIEILFKARESLADHEEKCETPARAILMNPGNFDLIGWDEVLGLPVLPDEDVEPMRVKILFGVGTGGLCEDGEVFWDADGNPYVRREPAEDV